MKNIRFTWNQNIEYEVYAYRLVVASLGINVNIDRNSALEHTIAAPEGQTIDASLVALANSSTGYSESDPATLSFTVPTDFRPSAPTGFGWTVV